MDLGYHFLMMRLKNQFITYNKVGKSNDSDHLKLHYSGYINLQVEECFTSVLNYLSWDILHVKAIPKV